MSIKACIMLATVIILHVSFFHYGSKSSEFHMIQNALKDFYSNRLIEVSVNEIDIEQTTSPDELIVTLLIGVRNKGDSPIKPAKFSLKTKESLEGNRVQYNNVWQPLVIDELAPGEQKEGALSFVIHKSDSFIFTYGQGIMSSHVKISSMEELFIPYIINS